MSVSVFCTLSNDTAYTDYVQESANGASTVKSQILIKGGANVADNRIVTPRGVHTMITDEEYAILKNNSSFKRHIEGGFITVKENGKKYDKMDADDVAKDMTERDLSAPLTAEEKDDDKTESVASKRKSK